MDPEGSGLFGASRGARAHAGLDLECNPGQEIVSPHPGYAKRIAYPYKDHQYEGIEIVHDMFISHLYYLHVSTKLIGKQIEGDQVVGIAQDISQKYSPKMKPHIHWTLYVNPQIFLQDTDSGRRTLHYKKIK